jgi:hypothetical protein
MSSRHDWVPLWAAESGDLGQSCLDKGRGTTRPALFDDGSCYVCRADAGPTGCSVPGRTTELAWPQVRHIVSHAPGVAGPLQHTGIAGGKCRPSPGGCRGDHDHAGLNCHGNRLPEEGSVSGQAERQMNEMSFTIDGPKDRGSHHRRRRRSARVEYLSNQKSRLFRRLGNDRRDARAVAQPIRSQRLSCYISAVGDESCGLYGGAAPTAVQHGNTPAQLQPPTRRLRPGLLSPGGRG